MRMLTCFVIMPSNPQNSNETKFLRDERWGLVENPSGCKGASSPDQVTSFDFNAVYTNIIAQAIKEVNARNAKAGIEITPTRGQDMRVAGDIIGQIMREVCTADITITDITGNNPNVFLEYGIRLSVRDALNIMICHKDAKDSLPFDVKHLRCIDYSIHVEDANNAKEKIGQYLQHFIDSNFLEPQQRNEPQARAADAPYSNYRRLVEHHTGRLMERKLVTVLERAPSLLIDFASYFFAKEKRPGLQQELFSFFDELTNSYRANPSGPSQAIELLQSISEIKNLSREKKRDFAYKIYDLTKDDPEKNDISKKWLDLYGKYEKAED